MSDVYVTQQPRKNRHGWVPNLEPASRYGAIRFIFTGDQRPVDQPKSSIIQATEQLLGFDWREDYLLWPNTGDPAALVCALVALSEILLDDASYIQMLYWERKLVNGKSSSTEGFYIPIRFPLNIALKAILNLEGKDGQQESSKRNHA